MGGAAYIEDCAVFQGKVVVAGGDEWTEERYSKEVKTIGLGVVFNTKLSYILTLLLKNNPGIWKKSCKFQIQSAKCAIGTTNTGLWCGEFWKGCA